MRLATRSTMLGIVLAGALVAQAGLRRYLEAAGPLPAVPLAQPLARVPLQLQDWRGVDRPIEDKRLLYADQRLQRTYRSGRNQAVQVWLAYSRDGADRGHHPEVCMAVAGKPEDREARKTLFVAGHPAPVQQYRFGRPGEYELVFYWYYTMFPPEQEGISPVQRLYQRLRRRPASLTIEVFAPEQSPEDAEAARRFVRLLDGAIQEHLPPTAVRGSRRIPVTVVDRPPPEK
jgi:EpsI family protein